MHEIINGYSIDYIVGGDFAEVRKIGHIDKFGRLMDCVFVFRGTWEECKEYALTH